MPITPQQKKILWTCAGLLAVVYYMRSPVTAPRQSPYARVPARTAGVTPPRTGRGALAAPAPTPAPGPFHDLLGQYQGRAALARGMCVLKFELRVNREKPDAFSGYSTLTCVPLNPWQQRRPAANMIAGIVAGAQPTSAILTGVAQSDAVRFHVDDTVSVAGGCAPTSFTVKPFGTNQIAAEWQDTCHGGAMLLGKSGR